VSYLLRGRTVLTHSCEVDVPYCVISAKGPYRTDTAVKWTYRTESYLLRGLTVLTHSCEVDVPYCVISAKGPYRTDSQL